MPKARKRKTPVTEASNLSVSAAAKPRSSRTVIRRFHVLTKEQARLQTLPPSSETLSRLSELQAEMDQLGGLEKYQQMSVIGQGTDRGGGSEKIFIQWLREEGLATCHGAVIKRLSLLEVGALKSENYKSCSSWIDVTPIDLHPRHSGILEQDFLMLHPEENEAKWDLISLSLVINFVPVPTDRGRMLVLSHKFLVNGGYLFLALPLPCVMNSRYVTPEYLLNLMEVLGFVQVKTRCKQGGKMAYWLFRKKLHSDSSAVTGNFDFRRKTVLRQGDRNNFAVLLP
ncbi:hypothetical protein FISHEDRAFT_39083 [Fistulina hepatica ATCC 64428]|uniref:25S rRNA adenine-N(1) methyltransferase n=1 Tax=Fistulina hepatica ATCC 64428 TaxID=1128425 RepID=A0A0D7AJP0_9AGAR|nr:hypothetical protein FISHEDRAFT_39083 [Fistulina hepatica ATCC 64428]